MDTTMDGISTDLVRRYEESEFQIIYDDECYSIVDTSIPMTIADAMTIADEFSAWVDALVFLEEKAKLI
jgi:hypothetical protein